MRLIETDTLSNQDISSALLAGTYTADAARLVFCRLFADQIAGNGDYIVYLTIQRAGAGSEYRASPITTAAVASGVTAAVFVTIGVPVTSTDVVKAYIDGLAGDTTTPDLICEWWEDNSLMPTTADRTLDVAATGEAGLDYDNVKAATAPTTLTNITVPTVTSAGTATGIPPIPAGTFINQMMDDGTAPYDRTTDSLQAVRDRGDAAWDTADVSALALETTAQSILTDTADMQPKLGTPAGASMSADIAAIEAQTDDIGAAGAGLTAVPWNASWDAEVESEALDALNTILADSVPADGTIPTLRQALYMITQFLYERSVSGTTVTVRKADGSTSLLTLTLNDGTTPTSITRAT